MASNLVVFVCLPGETDAVPAGVLTLRQREQDIHSTFSYDSRYLQRPNAIPLDPVSLPCQPYEILVPANGLSLFGAFRDATPDSWGRRVIEQRHGQHVLPEIAYLENSGDDRVGALDFRPALTSPCRKQPYNPVSSLPCLLDCADRIDNGETVSAQNLQMFQRGSSMGGARPKAVVEDESGLWLAKFPTRNDRFNYARVEAATLKLAGACDITIPEVRVQSLAGKDTFLIRRFDREKTDQGYLRKHFVSALTLLGKDETESLGSSYAEIAEAIRRYAGDRCEKRILELFRRMVFNILTSNTDDHLRNHGFVHEDGAYVLSPAYDMVPTPMHASERYQHLGVGKQGRLSTLDNALSGAAAFGLSKPQATRIIRNMVHTVSNWRTFFAQQGVSEADIATMGSAFRPPAEMGFSADSKDWRQP